MINDLSILFYTIYYKKTIPPAGTGGIEEV
jgi:hypothetical protein